MEDAVDTIQYANDDIDYGSVQYDKAVCFLLRFGKTDLASYLIVDYQDNKSKKDINIDTSKGNFIKRIRQRLKRKKGLEP